MQSVAVLCGVIEAWPCLMFPLCLMTRQCCCSLTLGLLARESKAASVSVLHVSLLSKSFAVDICFACSITRLLRPYSFASFSSTA